MEQSSLRLSEQGCLPLKTLQSEGLIDNSKGWESVVGVEAVGGRRRSVGAGWLKGGGVRGRRGPKKGDAEVGDAEIEVAGVGLKVDIKRAVLSGEL
ncbi:TPA: hypothetical protein ACH3X2_011229 [Trebouxia sp. C0005]